MLPTKYDVETVSKIKKMSERRNGRPTAIMPLTVEELQTVFARTESLLNSRPLTTVSGDVNDELVLTPNHFLIGKMGGELAPDTVDTTAVNVRKRWRRVQELIRRVWSRWMREYLASIGSRHK